MTEQQLETPVSCNPTLFTPSLRVVGSVVATTSDVSIANETMLFSADPKFARKNGGPLTRMALDALHDVLHGEILEGYHWVIDTRSTMLMPGMWPAIPGWHCDGVQRPKYGDQPAMSLMNPKIRHYTCTIATNPEVSRTQFITASVEVPVDPTAVWGSVDRYLNDAAGLGKLSMAHGELLEFTQPTLHRATASPARGWRWWFRMSEYHNPALNQIRNQVQVYSDPHAGW
jgi:hypothetical protein